MCTVYIYVIQLICDSICVCHRHSMQTVHFHSLHQSPSIHTQRKIRKQIFCSNNVHPTGARFMRLMLGNPALHSRPDLSAHTMRNECSIYPDLIASTRCTTCSAVILHLCVELALLGLVSGSLLRSQGPSVTWLMQPQLMLELAVPLFSPRVRQENQWAAVGSSIDRKRDFAAW